MGESMAWFKGHLLGKEYISDRGFATRLRRLYSIGAEKFPKMDLRSDPSTIGWKSKGWRAASISVTRTA